MKKYGLQLRVPPSQQKKLPTRPPVPTPLGFQGDDEDDVEREIARQATKNKAHRDIEEQHKKALEEDPTVFDYDRVYEDMKGKIVQPLTEDRQERKSKYIQSLLEKAKERERQHEIIYERKLAKERSKDDHLFADKDKFVTSAYKKKLAEQAKWLEEERLRQLQEEKEDVMKKGDMTDFYFNLSKNVAFGARGAEITKTVKEEKKEEKVNSKAKEEEWTKKQGKEAAVALQITEKGSSSSDSPSESPRFAVKDGRQGETSRPSKLLEGMTVSKTPAQDTVMSEQPMPEEPKLDHHKRSKDAVAAAKERFLARKKGKIQ